MWNAWSRTVSEAPPRRRSSSSEGNGTLGVARRSAVARARVARRRHSEDDRQRHRVHRLHVRLRYGCLGVHRGHRPAAHDRRVAEPGDGGRGDGPRHRVDRDHERPRRRGGRDPDPRTSDHRRGDVRRDRPPPPARQGLLDRRRLGGLRAELRVRRDARGRARRRRRPVRARPTGRRRGRARARDRAASRVRGPLHRARPRSARRDADASGSRARHPPRPEGGGSRSRTPLRHHGRAARRRDRRCLARRRRGNDQVRAREWYEAARAFFG